MAELKREKHHRYPWPVIEAAVTWYKQHNLTYRAVSDMMQARGIEVSHKTVYEWVQKFGKNVAKSMKKAGATPNFNNVADSYVKVNGSWKYLYAATDKAGHTLNLVLRSRKDAKAKDFLKKTLVDGK